MKKRLLIIGAGGFGREVLSWALDIDCNERDWDVGGFLDSAPDALDGYNCSYEIIGDPSVYQHQEGDCFICAIGDPKIKLKICNDMKSRGAQFVNIIHPTVVIGLDNIVGTGCVFCPNAMITTNVKIGDFVTINVRAGFGHDTICKDGVTLSPFCDVMGNAELEEGVFLGSHAIILPGVKIGSYSKIGAGSVVIRSVKSGSTMFGVPAKKIL